MSVSPPFHIERPLAWLPPGGATVEVTTRTIHGRFLLAPSQDSKWIFEGALGRALEKHPEIQLHGYFALSNHYTLLLTAPDAKVLADFLCHFNSKLARELGRLHGWREKIWGRRARKIPVVDEGAQVDRLRYLLAQGTKEGLVARPSDWPGASCVEALLTGKKASGVWFDRTAEYKARLRGEKPTKFAHAQGCEVKLTPLPCWAHLSEGEQRRLCADLVRGIEEDAAKENARRGRRPMGAKKVLAQEPLSRPQVIAKSPAPLVHASTRRARLSFFRLYASFVEMFRAAAEKLRRGLVEAIDEFPPGCFPPRFPFRSQPPGPAALLA